MSDSPKSTSALQTRRSITNVDVPFSVPKLPHGPIGVAWADPKGFSDYEGGYAGAAGDDGTSGGYADPTTAVSPSPPIRTFASGANRDTDAGKLDFEGFFSPLVIERFAEYMHKNRHLADGSWRDSDNWQRGIPRAAYMKSGFRHFFAWWRGYRSNHVDEEALCGLLFNAMGYLHEHLKSKNCD